MSSRIDSLSVHNEQRPASASQCFTKIILSRHSTRSFFRTPIPRTLLEEVLGIAQHAPSNSNLQPWRVKVVTGNALQRLTSSLLSAVSSGTGSTVEPIPDSYRQYRSELGKQLYGPDGYNIPRSDMDRMRNAQNRNYRFFDAPCALIVCMDRRLAQIDALSVGMYLQTLCLLLAERGLGTCVEASVAGYPQIIEQVLSLEKDMTVLAGVAIGFEDGDQKINHIKADRNAWQKNAEFVED